MDELLQAYLAGQAGAADALASHYRGLIYAIVSRILLNRSAMDPGADAEDLVQEVFLRLFKDNGRLLRTYDPGKASFATWLGIVARSTALSLVRRKRLFVQELDTEQHSPVAQEAEAPEPLPPIPAELLTARQKLVLQLVFERSLSVEEAAKTLGIDAQTVRSTKHKALERLRQHFGAPENLLRRKRRADGDDRPGSSVYPNGGE